MKTTHWVLLSSGIGARMGLPVPKTLAVLGQFEVFLYSFVSALRWDQTKSICLTVGVGMLDMHVEALVKSCRNLNMKLSLLDPDHPEIWSAKIKMTKSRTVPIVICYGGERRQDSVFRGLKVLRSTLGVKSNEIVSIHDTARPFLNLDVCRGLLEAVKRGVGVVPALPLEDTIKQVDSSNYVVRTISRKELARVQTPQVFEFSDIYRAHQSTQWGQTLATDDAQMAESVGIKIRLVQGATQMRKLTTGEDWQWAKNWIEYQSGELDKVTTSIHS